MTEVNEIEDIITKGMLLAEKSIRFHRSNHPCVDGNADYNVVIYVGFDCFDCVVAAVTFERKLIECRASTTVPRFVQTRYGCFRH